ncbi:MAG TPA: PIG-L family deacetylase [Candidatus Limnocylindrales bacterium]
MSACAPVRTESRPPSSVAAQAPASTGPSSVASEPTASPSPCPSPPKSSRISVYLTPHQDDETLSMGMSIAHDIAVGDHVVVGLLTDGSASVAIDMVNQRLAKEHRPLIDRAEFSAGRTNEFLAALDALGLSRDQVCIADLAVDQTLTVARAEAHLRQWVAMGATIHTMRSTNDLNPDHRALGEALAAVGDGQWMVYNRYWSETNMASCNYVDDRSVASRVRAAIKQYDVWNPSAQRYAIGWYSVGRYMSLKLVDPRDLACDTP